MDINMDKIKENVTKAAEIVADTAGRVVITAKKKMKKTEINMRIRDYYREIGELIYKNSKDEEDISDRLSFLFAELDRLNKEKSEQR